MSRTSAGVARRRALVTALLGAMLGCVLLATVVVGDLTGGASGPPSGAAGVVPADAYAYVHISTDRSRPEVRRALTMLERLPVEPALLTQLRSGLALAAPWLGSEAAFAVLPQGTLTVLDVRDQAAARRAVALVPAGTKLAFVRHYAVIGAPAVVSAALAAARTGSLLRTNAYRRASSDEPADRVADAYVSAAGVSRLLLAHAGVPAMLGTLLARPTLLGATLSVSPAPRGLRIHIHSAFDPSISGLDVAGSRPFTPTLQYFIPAGATLMLDQRALDRKATRLLVAAASGGVGGSIRPLLSRLGSALAAEGVNIPSVLRVFHGESAVALVPPNAAGGNPSLLIVARVTDEASARATLASVETPLSQLFAGTAAAAGQTPVLNDVAVGADAIHELALAPGLRLDYTVAHGLAIISTSRGPVTSVLRHAAALTGDRNYREVLPTGSNGVSSLVFLDFNKLLNLVGQTGLTRGARFAALRPDLQQIHAVGVRATSGEDDSTAELFLQIP